MQKKFVAVTLIFIFLLNAICPNIIYAKEMFAATYELAANNEEPDDAHKSGNPDNADNIQKHINQNGEKIVDNAVNNALAEVRSENGTRTVSIGNTTSVTEPIIGILSTLFNIFPTIVNYTITGIARMFGTNETNPHNNIGIVTPSENFWFVIEDIVFNKYKLFDIDFFDIPENLDNANAMGILNYNIAAWYFSLRNLAIVANLLILIYIGIRMAISTVADSKAKYKKMLINWFSSLFILFFMHYILATMFVIQDWLVEVVKNVLNALEQNRKRHWF